MASSKTIIGTTVMPASSKAAVSECKSEDIRGLLTTIESKASKVFQTIRIAVAGNVDSGKSTLTGVLTTGSLDNGRGSSREGVFNFEHEKLTGRTSSISTQILGFDSKGNPMFTNSSMKKKSATIATAKVITSIA